VDIQTVTEIRLSDEGPGAGREMGPDAGLPALSHPEWMTRWPWLSQGTTSRGAAATPFDLALFGHGIAEPVLGRWELLRAATGMPVASHSRQPHGSTVRIHSPTSPGLHLSEPADAHLTRAPGVLLAVTVADCVPITLVCEDPRIVGVIHAGWRGVVASVLEETISAVADRLGVAPARLHLHFGPAICGTCYEVGPEVHQALGLKPPEGPAPVDLRAALAGRAVRAGVPADQLSRSSHCTLCGDGDGVRHFFSHRAGDPERQVAWVGIGAGE